MRQLRIGRDQLAEGSPEGRGQRAEGFDGAEVLTAAKIRSCSFAPAPKSKIGKTKEGGGQRE